MYYVVPFSCTCEECGQDFNGLFYREVPVDDGSPLNSVMSTGLKELAHTVDARNTRKNLERGLREKRWSRLSSGGNAAGVSYGHGIPYTHDCPHCGARQSWDPMDMPKEPEKQEGALIYLLIGGFFCGIIGMLAGLFLMVFTNEMMVFVASCIVGIVVGCVLGTWVHRASNEELLETYKERRETYERALASYHAYQDSLAHRTTRHEPVPDLEKGGFADRISFSSIIRYTDPGCCPYCGKRLEGMASPTSLQVARARTNHCPWCAEPLPSYIHMKVGSD